MVASYCNHRLSHAHLVLLAVHQRCADVQAMQQKWPSFHLFTVFRPTMSIFLLKWFRNDGLLLQFVLNIYGKQYILNAASANVLISQALGVDDLLCNGFAKRTAAILEFYFRFRFWPSHRHRHGKLHRCTKCRQNRSTHSGVMTSYRFFKMAAIVGNLLPGSEFTTASVLEDGNLFAYQISMGYLKPRLRQNYFRFRKTHRRHIGKIFPVSTLA